MVYLDLSPVVFWGLRQTNALQLSGPHRGAMNPHAPRGDGTVKPQASVGLIKSQSISNMRRDARTFPECQTHDMNINTAYDMNRQRASSLPHIIA